MEYNIQPGNMKIGQRMVQSKQKKSPKVYTLDDFTPLMKKLNLDSKQNKINWIEFATHDDSRKFEEAELDEHLGCWSAHVIDRTVIEEWLSFGVEYLKITVEFKGPPIVQRVYDLRGHQ